MIARVLALAGFAVLSLPCVFAQQNLPAAQRGVEPIAPETSVPHGHHYIVAIGIDHYQNWPILATAVSDATGFARLLTTQFGFEYAVEPLTEKNATRDAINSLIDDELRHRLHPEDDVIIFFAGHGTTRTDKFGYGTQAASSSVGFIVPVDARAPSADEHWSDYINIEELLHNIGTLPAAHILVILDSCHSGMALGNKFSASRGDNRFEQDMLTRVSREVIASAQGDQLAADSGPLPTHSLFTGLLIQGLTTGKADSFHQGFITAAQLGAYAQHEVAMAQGSRQTPLFGSFDPDNGGALIIPLGTGTPAPATALASSPTPSNTLTTLQSLEVARIRKDASDYWVDNDPSKNFPAARSASLQLCDSGDMWGCAQASISFRSGLGGGVDYTRAIDLARQACQSGISEACVTLGTLYESGQTIEADLGSARQLYEQSCAHNDLHGCVNLGRLYLLGHGVPMDKARAAAIFSKACDAGNILGCADLAWIYDSGSGVARDYTRAMSLDRRACDRNQMRACMHLGAMYLYGHGVPTDPSQAVVWFRKSCAGGDMFGCRDLGLMYEHGEGVAKDLSQAATFYRKACDGGEMAGCLNLGWQYLNGEGMAKDTPQALALLQKACDGGNGTACFALGATFADGQEVTQDKIHAASLYRRACDNSEATGCVELGSLFDQGIAQDNTQAFQLYRKACDMGEMSGCAELAYDYAHGRGVARDDAQAATLFRQACTGGNQMACDSLKALQPSQ